MKSALNILTNSQMKYYAVGYISFLFLLGSVIAGIISNSILKEEKFWKKK